MSLRFWKNFGKVKLQDANKQLHDAIVSFDPEGATEAAIAEMEEQFDEINLRFSTAKQTYEREKREADEIQAVYNQRLEAAEILQAKVAAGGAGSKNAEQGLALLLDELETLQGDVQIEVEEAEDAKLLMDDLQDTVNIYADKLKTARRDMQRAATNMERAKAKQERAEVRADQAAASAGLREAAGGLGSALESMQRQADEAMAAADSADNKSKLLGKSEVTENDAVAAALAEAKGESAKPQSVTDRLAALKAG